MRPRTAIEREYIPKQLQIRSFEDVQPFYDELLHRNIGRDFDSPDDVDRWLLNFAELTTLVDQVHAQLEIEIACNTEDPDIEKRYLEFIENFMPKVRRIFFQLQKKLLDNPYHDQTAFDPHHTLIRNWQADIDLFCEQNIPIQTQLSKLAKQYAKLRGSLMVEYQGQEYTLQQIGKFLEEPDREVRSQTWKLRAQATLDQADQINNLFQQMLEQRQAMAQNAGLDNYRDYEWKSKKRFDYSPEQCRQYADAVAEYCMPVLENIHAKRARTMDQNMLRPWDLAVDPNNRPPLRPFDPEQIEHFVDGVKDIFFRIHPTLARQFEELRRNDNLDLASRKGKRPGGFQCSLEEYRQPFIFMNAVGSHGDVQTLLHEGGHAFHYQAACRLPLIFTKHAPIEFCEVASMSMELLAMDHLEVFYDTDQANRARRMQLERIVTLLPWVAVIDQFQHWLYTHKDHTAEQRTDQWLTILNTFTSTCVDWTSLEQYRQILWQNQQHLFSVPFYYIEYGIAQLGALQIWLNYRLDPRSTLQKLQDAFARGGVDPLPMLFQTAGIQFDFSGNTIEPLMRAVADELDRLPE